MSVLPPVRPDDPGPTRDEQFKIFVRRHSGELNNYASKMLRDVALAEDVVQEAFVRAWRYRDRVVDGSDGRAWLYRVVRNLVIDHVRARRARPPEDLCPVWYDVIDAQQHATVGSYEADPAISVTNMITVTSLLDRLSPAHRVALVLVYLEDLQVQEVAAILRIPPGTVKSRCYYALRELRNIVENADQDINSDRTRPRGGGAHALSA